MRVIYTQHARLRMVQRHISEAEVEATLADPVITYFDPDGNKRFVGDVNGRKVQVVIVDSTDPPVVKTVID